MQEGDLNDSYSRMRLQLLRDGQLPQMQQQQGSAATTQGTLGLGTQGPMWNSDAAPPGHGQNAWSGQFNNLTQTAGIGGPSGDKHPPNAAGNTQGPGTYDARVPSSTDLARPDCSPEQNESGLWSGSPFGGISRSIWSGGKPDSRLFISAWTARIVLNRRAIRRLCVAYCLRTSEV